MRWDSPVYEDSTRRSIMLVRRVQLRRLGSEGLRNKGVAGREPLEQILVFDIVNRDVEMFVILDEW